MKESYMSFQVDEQLFALPISDLDRVVQVVKQEPLPEAPAFISGVIDYHGTVLPVINMRLLFQLPARELSLSDQMIIVHTQHGKYALLIDRSLGLLELDVSELEASENISYGKKLLKGVLRSGEGMVFINDPNSFLNNEELLQVEQALSKKSTR